MQAVSHLAGGWLPADGIRQAPLQRGQSATSASDSSELALALAEALPTYCPTDELAGLVSSTRQHILSRRQEQTTFLTRHVL